MHEGFHNLKKHLFASGAKRKIIHSSRMTLRKRAPGMKSRLLFVLVLASRHLHRRPLVLPSYLACCLILIAMSGCSSGSNSATNASIMGAGLHALSCTSSSMAGAGSDSCTVTLTMVAGSGGLSVSLSSNNGAVAVPAMVMVPASATSAVFTASVSPVTSAQVATLTASSGGVIETFILQLNAAGPALSINPASVAFGNVTVNTSSTFPVTLTSAGSAPVAINSGTLTGKGFTMSGATFPVTLNPGLKVTLDVVFDPTAATAATGQLTIVSNSSTNSVAVIPLSGTGENVSHQVTLKWSPPSSSPVAIVGYNVYRSAGGGDSYLLLNSSLDTQTTYLDTAVQAGSTYGYIVASVDSSGTESIPSNEATATIP